MVAKTKFIKINLCLFINKITTPKLNLLIAVQVLKAKIQKCTQSVANDYTSDKPDSEHACIRIEYKNRNALKNEAC